MTYWNLFNYLVSESSYKRYQDSHRKSIIGRIDFRFIKAHTIVSLSCFMIGLVPQSRQADSVYEVSYHRRANGSKTLS